MRIVLVTPPSPFLIDERVFPFLGPLQIAAVAREQGHSVRVVDREPYDLGGADLVGFYSLAAQYPWVVERARSLDTVTVLGGPHANTNPTARVGNGFDYVVASDQGGGGGEPGFIELLKALDSGQSLDPVVRVPSRVPNLTYQGDLWPFPARDLIDLPSYRYFINGERATSIVSTTGCPFACTFCCHWGGYRKLEMKSPGRVRKEIRQIRERYGWRAIMFYDDEVNLRPDFLDGFLSMLRSEDVIWRAFFKGGKRLTIESVFQRMAESGCVQLCTGAESADPVVLKKLRKGTTVQDNTNFVRLCVKYGIKPKVFTQVGLPGETPESAKALRDWLVQMAGEGLADADVTITTPYEGAPIWSGNGGSLYYKGTPGRYEGHEQDLVSARQWVEDEFRKAAGLEPLVPL